MRGNGLTAESYIAVAAVDRMHAGDALLVLREVGVAAYVVLDDDGTAQVFADREAVPQARSALHDLSSESPATESTDDTGSVDTRRDTGSVDTSRRDTGSVDSGSVDSGSVDTDEAWQQILAGYDENAHEPPSQWTLPDRISVEPEPEPEPEPDHPPGPPRAQPTPTDGLNTEATWDDEGHFVPPTPPPVMPPRDLVARLAWGGLVGGPVLLLVAVVLGIALPTEAMMICSLGFVGGLVTLIVRLKDRGDDGFGPDDGARL